MSVDSVLYDILQAAFFWPLNTLILKSDETGCLQRLVTIAQVIINPE